MFLGDEKRKGCRKATGDVAAVGAALERTLQGEKLNHDEETQARKKRDFHEKGFHRRKGIGVS